LDQNAIFLPVLALMGWTFLVLLMIPFRRFKAAFAKEVCADDFRCGESDNVPLAVRLPNRMFMNLLEMPTLFYALAVILFLTHNVDALCVALAWGYVGLRVLHSVITLTYNHIFHRFLAFAFSNVIVLGLWLKLAGALLK
jgi:hypothetical protein